MEQKQTLEHSLASSFEENLAKRDFSQARAGLVAIEDAEYRAYLKSQLDTAIGEFLRAEARENPVKALEMIMNPSDGFESFWLEVAMEVFLWADRDAAAAWYDSIRLQLDIEQNDRILLAFARYELGQGALKNARKYQQMMKNEELVVVVQGELAGLIEQEIRSMTRGNPAQALESLLQENSEHEVFWIEVAVNEYLKKDADAVLKWYRENRWRLTSSQNDRVALAYARHAKSVNRTHEAVKWAGMIEEPDLRTSVGAEVRD